MHNWIKGESWALEEMRAPQFLVILAASVNKRCRRLNKDDLLYYTTTLQSSLLSPAP